MQKYRNAVCPNWVYRPLTAILESRRCSYPSKVSCLTLNLNQQSWRSCPLPARSYAVAFLLSDSNQIQNMSLWAWHSEKLWTCNIPLLHFFGIWVDSFSSARNHYLLSQGTCSTFFAWSSSDLLMVKLWPSSWFITTKIPSEFLPVKLLPSSWSITGLLWGR